MESGFERRPSGGRARSRRPAISIGRFNFEFQFIYLLIIEVLAAIIRRLVRLFGGPRREVVWWWWIGGLAGFINVPFTSRVVPPAEASLPFVTTFAFFTICTTLVFSVLSSRFSESSSSETDSLFTRFCSSEVPSPFALLEPFDEPAALPVLPLAELFEDPLFALLTIKLLLLLRVFAC